MNRRDFQIGLAAWLVASGTITPSHSRAQARASASSSVPRASQTIMLPTPRRSSLQSLAKPRALKRGDVVGLIAPSGATNDAFVQQRVKNLEAFGFRVKISKNILATRGNTAGTIAQRVADIHDMFNDAEVTALWAVRGGSGASQLLPYLDYALMRQKPKVLIGYSDVTALHLAMLRHAGLVTFHGPVASAAFTDYTATQLEAVLMHPRPQTVIHMAQINAEEARQSAEFGLRTVAAGVAEGRLVGGNLAVMSALVGTPFEANTRDALLFLEEIREAPYRIDRMLTQMHQSQRFNHLAGTMLGVFRRSNSPDDEPRLSLSETIDDHFAHTGKPAGYGYSFGHIANQFTIPQGIRARLDTRAHTLTLLEAAVRAR